MNITAHPKAPTPAEKHEQTKKYAPPTEAERLIHKQIWWQLQESIARGNWG